MLYGIYLKFQQILNIFGLLYLRFLDRRSRILGNCTLKYIQSSNCCLLKKYPKFTPQKYSSQNTVSSVFFTATTRFGLLQVFWVADHEFWVSFGEKLGEHPKICKNYPHKGVFFMYLNFEQPDLVQPGFFGSLITNFGYFFKKS